MSGWNSRIKIRIDDEAAYQSLPTPRLDAGELAASVSGTSLHVRIGTEDNQPFDGAATVMSGEAGMAPMVLDAGAASSGAGMPWWDGSQWQADATPIPWDTSNASGAVTYTDSTDAWGTNAALAVIDEADGGSFAGSFTAPAFTGLYAPSLADIGSNESPGSPEFLPAYSPSIGTPS